MSRYYLLSFRSRIENLLLISDEFLLFRMFNDLSILVILPILLQKKRVVMIYCLPNQPTKSANIVEKRKIIIFFEFFPISIEIPTNFTYLPVATCTAILY